MLSVACRSDVPPLALNTVGYTHKEHETTDAQLVLCNSNLRNPCKQIGNTPRSIHRGDCRCRCIYVQTQPHLSFLCPPLLRALPATDPPGGNGGGEAALDKTIKGLPPMAVLAGSHGGRLVASGITVAGDRGGGGFNVKAARAAARTALRQAGIAQELAIEEERKAKGARAGPRQRVAALAGCPRQQRRDLLGSRRDGNRGASSWGWGQHHESGGKLSRKDTTSATASGSHHGVGHHSSGGSVAPSFGGTAHSSGSVGTGGGGVSIVGTEASSSGGPSIREAEATRKLRGLNEDSVIWASSMRGSNSSRNGSSRERRRRKEDRAGQVETIQRLVHMGLL